jgi:four helix bundle protein
MDYKNLIVWNKAMELTEEVYAVTSEFPKQETYGLTNQMRRAAVSVPSNIDEGSRRKGNDTRQFLRVAYGSGAELETQLELSKRLKLATRSYERIESLLDEVMRMLNVMINK